MNPFSLHQTNIRSIMDRRFFPAPPVENFELFYDGSCPLCSFEINHLRKLKDDKLILTDVTTMAESDTLPKEALLKRLHLKTPDGLVTGLDATVGAWRQTRFGFLFAWLRWPGIRVIADKVYNNWADRRFEKRYGFVMDEGMCGNRTSASSDHYERSYTDRTGSPAT